MSHLPIHILLSSQLCKCVVFPLIRAIKWIIKPK
jgi:hypothetical protein